MTELLKLSALNSVFPCLPAWVQIKQLPAHWYGTLQLVCALLNWAEIAWAAAGPGRGWGGGGGQDEEANEMGVTRVCLEG